MEFNPPSQSEERGFNLIQLRAVAHVEKAIHLREMPPQASAEFETPVSLGVLTCDTTEQALARAGGDHGNKGWDAALAALEMVDLLDRLDAADST